MRVYDMGGNGRSVTVLVADDNDVARRLCRRVLEKAGHKVLTASDGQEAVAVTLANSPDVILLDVAMPGIHGLDEMRQIREQRPGMAIVIASAHLLPSDREMFLAAGADEMLIPPFRLVDLVAVIDKVTANPRPHTRDLTGTRLASHLSPDDKFYWDGTWRQAVQLSPDRKHYWDGKRWVPEALMAEEGFVPGYREPNTPKSYWNGQRWVPEALAPEDATMTSVPIAEQPPDVDRLAADLEAVWKRVESGQLALGESDEDLYSLFETLIARLRSSRAGNGSGPSLRMRALQRAKHRPVIQTFLGRKYEDDEGLAVATWDGKVRLGCRCGWRYSRVEPASTAPASAGSLSDAWREHVMADMAGVEYRG